MPESFQSLLVWQRAIELTVQIYQLTSKFPDSERFGLTNQLRRAAVSVASNIAEGYGRTSGGEYIQFLGHARGSNHEIETQLIIARQLGFGAKQTLDRGEELSLEVSRMLSTMIIGMRKRR